MRTVLFYAWLLCGAAPAGAAQPVYPGPDWARVAPGDVGLDEGKLARARDYALTGGGSGYITRHGRLVMSWGPPRQRYDLKSTSKSIGVTALGLALADGKMKLADPARRHHPQLGTPPEQNAATGWLDDITILHLATQTAGFEKPGGYQPLLFRPGSKWHYSDGGPNWLAECVTLAYGRDVQELLFERVFEPIGITRDDLRWRNNAYRAHTIAGVARREFGSGVHANVDAMARIGYLYLRRGQWQGKQLLPAEFIARAQSTVEAVVGLPEHAGGHGNASDHYGLLWWNNADGTLADVPRTTYWSWGLYESLIVVIPELDIVVARAGKSWPRREGANHYDVLAPFLQPIVAAVQDDGPKDDGPPDDARRAPPAAGRRPGAARPAPAAAATPPYPPSAVITGIHWSAPQTIVRGARGSDNWPLTWADDDRLYTAYGDGHGFAPRVERKLSLGLARVEGGPGDFRGVNIRSASGEALGDGPRGRKASGLLMVDGVLYIFVRNAGHAQLGWSTDHARSWTWADWKFTTSFGYPTLLNFGRNYAGARDEFVYVYSHDAGSAYQAADRMVLARVPRERLRERSAYEFFERRDAAGQAQWTPDIERRGAVFEHPGRCWRSGISYHPVARRYLWCQTLPASSDARGPRFAGGFGIYDAPQPWGPWTTVFFTAEWDVGPGETSSFPSKWFSPDGRTVHLVFSGDDCFSVRQATLDIATRP